jgi:pyruvate dehydrogenase E2 component (dihydrolipoamide acetyltransferase)
MLGVARFTAVINSPQAAILAVGAAAPRPVVRADGTVGVGRVMELTISAAHRIVYGAEAAEFLGTVRKRLERPAGLLL